MKKYGMILCALFGFIIASVCIYHALEYTIDIDSEGYKHQVEELFNQSEFNTNEKIDLQKTSKIADSSCYISLFVSKNHIGHVVLERSWFGKYKFTQAVQSSQSVTYTDVMTRDGNFIVLAGENKDLKLNRIEGELENYTFQIDIPKDEYFIVYKELPESIEKTEVMKVRVYNQTGHLVK